jgi:DNA polymerase-3 subunit alpha
MPDIDVDFPDEYRDEVKEYVKDKYGEKCVAGVIAVGSLKAKAVLDDLGKVLKIEQDKINRLKRFIIKPKDRLKDVYDNNDEFRNIINNDERLKLLYETSLVFEDFPRNTTIHASGVIISKKDLEKIIPVIYEDEKLISSFEGGYLEDLGLLKMDFLGNANLTIIMNIMKMIKEKENIDIDFLKIPLDDKETLKCFYDIDTNGIFQFDSDVMKNLLSKFKIESFDDIVAAISLVRPGPDTNTYIERKNNNYKPNFINKEVEKVLGNTYGVLVYQEQVMQIARVIGGFTMSEADNLRRAMSKKKKELLSSYKEKFVTGGLKNGYNKDFILKMYDDIYAFSEYGFNKSHAVAYAVIAYKMAYFKVHYSKYFYLNLLSMIIGDEKETSKIIKEAKKRGVIFLLPDINKSTDLYEIEENAIRFPLSNIKDIGFSKAKQIMDARGEGFKDIYEAFVKLNEVGINRKVLENLIYAGAFNSFNYNKNTLISNLDNLLTYAYIAKGIESDIIEHPSIEDVEEFDKKTLMEYEKNLFGFYLTHHPASLYKDKYKVTDLIEVSNNFSKVIDTLVLVEKIKTHKDKNGNEMAFITGSDETDECEYIFFSSSYKEIDTVKRGNIILVRGRVEKRNAYQIIAEKSKIIS